MFKQNKNAEEKITVLNNNFTREQNNNAVLKKHKQRFKRRRLLSFGLIMAVFIIFVGTQAAKANTKMQKVNTQIAQQEKVLKKSKIKQSELKIQSKQLEDEDYVMKLIRQKYYWSKAGETIYSLPEDKSKTLFDSIEQNQESDSTK